MNPLQEIANVVKDDWYSIDDMAMVVANIFMQYGLLPKKAVPEDIELLLVELAECGFLHYKGDPITEVRVAPHYIPKQGEAHGR